MSVTETGADAPAVPPDASVPRSVDEAAALLADGAIAALPGWVERCVVEACERAGVTAQELGELAQAAGEQCVAEIGPPLRDLLATDVDEQQTTPLSVLRGAVRFPTEVLAEQHAQTLAELLEPLGVRVERISGGIPAATKRRLWRDVAAGDIGVVVGTQALIQQSARFARLNLAVVDEQHRFGVQQRGEIRAKGYNPHLLAMTATPIPRTLALTFYGDLDITSIREMPQGREPVRTAWVPQSRRADAYAFVRQQVESGGQAFVICPLIQESESLQVRSAKDEFERLTTQVYPDLAHAIGLLHGRLSAKAKDAVMRAFRDGEVKILVGTAVVEVGIDVPQATVIMIEGAERFGLSQLHQLRGRVGRGGRQSHCLLLSDTTDATENARLRILQSVHDGFKLAERDLELRGPGDILGTRQHGLTGFQFASVSDMEMIWRTREDAEAIIQVDPELERPEHARLAVAVQSMLQESEWS